MKSKIYKSKNLRKLFHKYEKIRKIYKFLSINLLSNPFNKDYFPTIKTKILQNKVFYKVFSKTKIKSRCVLTNRSKSVSKRHSFSRIALREFINLGILPGYKKAVW